MWKHQADKLGIVLDRDGSPSGAADTAGHDVLPEGSFLTEREIPVVDGRLSPEVCQLTETQILDALADEYRVIIAQEALLGKR